MTNVLLLAWITFKESVRNKALYGIFSFGLLLFFANIVFTGMFSFELGKVAIDVGLSVVSFSGLVIIFFLGVPLLTNDLDRKTIYLILSRPISKTQYVVGKYVGLLLTILLSSTVLGGLSAISVLISTWNIIGALSGSFSWAMFLLSVIYITLALCVVMALAMVWVTISTHQFTAILFTLISYFVGQNVENVKNVALRSEVFSENGPLITLVEGVSWLFPNLAAFDLKTTVSYGLHIGSGYLTFVGLYGIGYIALCLFCSAMILQRRELG